MTEAAPPALPVRRKGGIFYGWWIVISGFLANFAYAEQFNTSYGVFVYQLGAEQGWSRTVLAGVSSVSRIPEAILSSLLGPLVDRHGARWLVAIGGLLVGGSFMALSTIDEVWELYLYKGLLMPIGAVGLGGFIGVTVSNWFVLRRGRALGIITMGSFAASSTMPLAAANLIELWGWRQAWFVMGLLVIILCLPAVVVFRRRPEDIGLYPDGLEPGEVARQPASERERRRQAELLRADRTWTRGEAIRTPMLWIIIFAWGLSSLAVTATNLHLVPYVQGLGYPVVIAAGAVTLRSSVALVSSPLWGLVVDRLPIHLAASLQFGFKAVAMLLFLFAPTSAGLACGLVAYGLGVGGSMITQDAILANYYGRTSLGLVRSVAYPLQLGFAAAGPFLMGLAYDLAGSYQHSWWLLFLGFVVSALLIQVARPPRRPNRPPQPAAT